ncbi:hypothetical protein DPMN_164261 [Dreissena polymorpha]|uniref:Zinc finger PHD-type domain-containing protein n=1 Tax=Dreissena polymorpha TaxID=45954 RepID=A0A9D4EUT8_DREPO|nr:hypothetical protein DPMN_164261 [Dreissena polymorpha]
MISPALKKILIYPVAETSKKAKRTGPLQDMPDNLTSPSALRTMALKELLKIRQFVKREKMAKAKCLKKFTKKSNDIIKPKTLLKSSKCANKNDKKNSEQPKELEVKCMVCHMTWEEDQLLQTGSIWIQCDQCDSWMHKECCSDNLIVDNDDPPLCCPGCE